MKTPENTYENIWKHIGTHENAAENSWKHLQTLLETIEAPEKTAVNYLVQSTAADLFLRQMIKIWGMLKDKKSYVAFCLHDSLVIDLAEEDDSMINDLKEEFANTSLGLFKINSFGGKNFGEMKRLNLN